MVKAIIFIICILIVHVFAFSYLKLNNKPVKSDIVVLFIGLEYEKRLEEAHQLLKENYAKALIIPAYHSEYIPANGKINRTKNFHKGTLNTSAYPGYYENTHIEALEAKKMMDIAGYKSAIFVSSPFHMRRISIIASRVFEVGNYEISFIGSRYLGQDNSFLSIFKWYKIKQIFSEYLKIAGFFLYQLKEYIIQP
ncbi:MAG: YdcF family protein [Desulfobacula sp.]|nr:YdcF family protein [Desulfobacula sp.]